MSQGERIGGIREALEDEPEVTLDLGKGALVVVFASLNRGFFQNTDLPRLDQFLLVSPETTDEVDGGTLDAGEGIVQIADMGIEGLERCRGSAPGRTVQIYLFGACNVMVYRYDSCLPAGAAVVSAHRL